MEEFRGIEYHAAMLFGRGRGQSGTGPDQGFGQDVRKAIGRARGRATGRPRAFGSESSLSPSSSSSSSSSSSAYSSVEASVSSEGSTWTWESFDNLPEKNGYMIFCEDTSNSKDDCEQDEGKAYPPKGFLDPLKVTLPTLSDSIDPGDERYCAVYTMANTDSIYLIFSHYFSHAIDAYIRGMGRWYFDKVRNGQKLLHLNVRDEQLVTGAIVVVYHKAMKEWKRARILESFNGKAGKMYRVLFLDLGDYADVCSINIVYLHEMWRAKPVFAIRAKLALLTNSLEEPRWNKLVTERILDAVQNKMVLVKFVEQVEFQKEKTWIVSLLSMKDRLRSACEGNRGGDVGQAFCEDQPIEERIIANLIGHQ